MPKAITLKREFAQEVADGISRRFGSKWSETSSNGITKDHMDLPLPQERKFQLALTREVMDETDDDLSISIRIPDHDSKIHRILSALFRTKDLHVSPDGLDVHLVPPAGELQPEETAAAFVEAATRVSTFLLSEEFRKACDVMTSAISLINVVHFSDAVLTGTVAEHDIGGVFQRAAEIFAPLRHEFAQVLNLIADITQQN